MEKEPRSDNTQLDFRGRARVQTVNTLPSKTTQADAKRADINEILRQHKIGIVPHLQEVDAKYLDVSEFTDYADMMMQLRQAEKDFMSLPSKVREIFNHDVAVWLDAAHAGEVEQNALAERVAMASDSASVEDSGTTVESSGEGTAE
jgi:hypothetical protein